MILHPIYGCFFQRGHCPTTFILIQPRLRQVFSMFAAFNKVNEDTMPESELDKIVC